MLLPHFMNNNEFPDAVFLASRLPEQMLTRHTGASQALLCEGLPIPVHEGLDGHGGADIGRVVPLAEEALQQVGLPVVYSTGTPERIESSRITS